MSYEEEDGDDYGLTDVACETCGEEYESWDLIPVQARSEEAPVRRVCSGCYEDAMESDRDFWRRYWYGAEK